MLLKTMVVVALAAHPVVIPSAARDLDFGGPRSLAESVLKSASDVGLGMTPPTCITPDRTGTFRIVATRAGGTDAVPALLLLENINGCLEATFVTDDHAPAAIDQLALSANTLKGRISVTGELAVFTVRFDDARVVGSIVAKKQAWQIEGRKTS
jgi:hypothetical protein